MLKAVIFDMDGVITDNNPYHEKAWAEFCRSHGVVLTMEEVHHHIYGRLAKDTLEYVFKKKLSRAEIDGYVEQKEKIYRNIYSPFIQPTPGLLPFIELLLANHILLGLATSAPTGNVDFTFDHIAIGKKFNVILDGESIVHGKPNPEIYLKAIKMLNLDPEECVIFEDSIPGIQAAFASGAHVVGLSTTHQKDELKDIKWIIKDFTGLTMDFLHEVVG